LRDVEDFVDVTLACDGKSFTAHKMVLSACSPYFRHLLKVNNPKKNQQQLSITFRLLLKNPHPTQKEKKTLTRSIMCPLRRGNYCVSIRFGDPGRYVRVGAFLLLRPSLTKKRA
jgi:hypothetical protein